MIELEKNLVNYVELQEGYLRTLSLGLVLQGKKGWITVGINEKGEPFHLGLFNRIEDAWNSYERNKKDFHYVDPYIKYVGSIIEQIIQRVIK